MRCSLCGADNPDTVQRCQLCDTTLENSSPEVVEAESNAHIALGTADVSSVSVHWGRIAQCVALLAFIALPWMLMSDLFKAPEDVKEVAKVFSAVKDRYFANREQWDQQKDQVLKVMARHYRDGDLAKQALAIEDIPFEVVLAYLADELNLITEKDQDLTIYPVVDGNDPRLLITKKDQSLWPFKVQVSLELLLDGEPEGVTVKFLRFRRGTREESPALAWQYFGKELQSLRRLESYAGGVRQLLLYKKAIDSENKIPSTYISWKYQHKAMTT